MNNDILTPEVLERLNQLKAYCMDTQLPENNGASISLEYEFDEYPIMCEFADMENKLSVEGRTMESAMYSRGFMKISKIAACWSVFNGKNVIGKQEFELAKKYFMSEVGVIAETLPDQSNLDLLLCIKCNVFPVIVKSLKGGYSKKSNCNVSKKMKTAGNAISKSTLRRTLKNNSALNDLNDNPEKQGIIRTGLEKCIDYMIKEGFFKKMTDDELKYRARVNSGAAYKITKDFFDAMRE